MTGNRVQLTDRSSYGGYLTIGVSAELIAWRETVVLADSGRFSPGATVESPDAAAIDFEVSVD